jgi:uncharacterized protein
LAADEPISRIGWTWHHAVRELILCVVCFVRVFLGIALLTGARALLRAGLSAPATPLPSFLKAQGLAGALLAVLPVAVLALAEETIFPGHLLLGFSAVLRNTTASPLLSSAIFARKMTARDQPDWRQLALWELSSLSSACGAGALWLPS